MRDRMERLVLLPFSVGCISESSIAVAVQHQQQPRRSSKPPPPPTENNNSSAIRNREEDEESISSDQSAKGSFRFLSNSKPDISNGFHRLCKSFKNISQLFAYKEEMEELEEEMEIGLPTDVKHVTHIGLDGCTTATTHDQNNNNNNNNHDSNNMKGNSWDSLMISSGLLSLGQFELSMAASTAEAEAEAEAKAPPAGAALVKNSSVKQLN